MKNTIDIINAQSSNSKIELGKVCKYIYMYRVWRMKFQAFIYIYIYIYIYIHIEGKVNPLQDRYCPEGG